MPNTGKLVTITGSNALCMAQATEVPIPIASQFNFIFIVTDSKDSIFAIRLQVLKGLKQHFKTFYLRRKFVKNFYE